MPVIRTPEKRFANLPDFPYEPHHVEINGLRVHYVKRGEGAAVLWTSGAGGAPLPRV